MNTKEVKVLLEKVRSQKPLIHNITNAVVTNFNANGIIAMGASPVMTNAVEEAADMASAADALVLNIGTLDSVQVEAMYLAGKAANKKGIPIVLDPVGAGATPYRTNTTRELMENLDISLLRGNAGEISAITGMDGQIKGVDAISAEKDTKIIAEHASFELGIPVAVTGPVDAVTDGCDVYKIYNGHSMMSRVTGTGCLASAVTAAFLSQSDHVLIGAASALGYYGAAAERAEGFASMQGPGTFQAELLNALHNVGEMDLRQKLNIHLKSAGGTND